MIKPREVFGDLNELRRKVEASKVPSDWDKHEAEQVVEHMEDVIRHPCVNGGIGMDEKGNLEVRVIINFNVLLLREAAQLEIVRLCEEAGWKNVKVEVRNSQLVVIRLSAL